MIELIKQRFTKDMSGEEKLNRTRELLQLTALKIMYDKDIFKNLAFTGGTALRVLFDLRRFSEDLDFSLIDKKEYSFKKIDSELIRGFKLYGLDMETKPKEDKTVQSTMLKFPGLLKLIGLSPLAGQKLSIKIEIDTNPPEGGNTNSTIINKTYMFNITHFDLPSMFATKLTACFYRKYTKGRDFYDFIWCLGRKIEPNYTLLNNAIKQTHTKDPGINKDDLKKFLLRNIEKVDFTVVKKDVERFLEDKSELKLFELNSIKKTIELIY